MLTAVLLGCLASCAATTDDARRTETAATPRSIGVARISEVDPGQRREIEANRQRILHAASLVPDSVYHVLFEDGEPSFEYPYYLKKYRFNTQLARHADEIHSLVAEVVASPAGISLTEDPAWHRPMKPEDAAALGRLSELTLATRLLTRYLMQESARRVRAGRPGEATDSLGLMIDLNQKCTSEPNSAFRLSAVGLWMLSDEDFAPVVRRLKDDQRARLAKSLDRFETSDPIGLREHAFREAGISIEAFERSLAAHGGTSEIAGHFRELHTEMYEAVREPGELFYGKQIYVMYSHPAWADAMERVSEGDANRRLARAKELVDVLKQARDEAEVSLVLDEMIADESFILAMLLGELPATLDATWNYEERLARLRETLTPDAVRATGSEHRDQRGQAQPDPEERDEARDRPGEPRPA